MPTKLESELSPEEFSEFCARVAHTKGATKLSVIQGIAKEFGVTISLRSARAVKAGALGDCLAQLNEKRGTAEAVAAANSGLSLSLAAASILSGKLFDRMLKDGDLAADEAESVSMSISRLRRDDRQARKVAADLALRDEQIAKLQRAKADRDAQIIAKANKLRGAASEEADQVRDAVIEQIDRVMGLKK